MPIRRIASRLILGTLLLMACIALIRCADPVPIPQRATIIPAGKLDDYRSTAAVEYTFRATVDIVVPNLEALEPEVVAQVAAALANNKMNGVARGVDRALRAHWNKDARVKEGVAVTLRQETTAKSLTELSPGHYSTAIEGEVAGPPKLLSQLPLEVVDNKEVLPIKLDGEMVNVSFQVQERTPDAYPRYDLLLADGLDIALFIGGDYNDARFDRQWAEEAFNGLIERGFTAPAASVTEMTLDSAPLSRTIAVGGKAVQVRVKLVHAEMGRFGPMTVPAPARPAPPQTGAKWPEETVDTEQLEHSIAAFEELVKTADVVVMQGHSGLDASYSGVVMHYNPRVALEATRFRELELPESYQIFFFSGCETYAMYADQLYAHPKKDPRNLDIITTVNYTVAGYGMRRVLALVDGFLAEDTSGQFVSRSWDQLLEPLNVGYANYTQQWVELFGVHGLEDNPTISPFADLSTLGEPCEDSSHCPGGENLCIDRSFVKKPAFCGIACVDGRDCPGDTVCMWVALGIGTASTSVAQQCAPVDLWTR